MRKKRISVVLPTLNESALLHTALTRLMEMEGVYEVIVADGGSDDGTLALAGTFDQVKVLTAPRGRASQMNAGAAVCTGEILLFLHVDVRLPQDACGWVKEILAEPCVVAGAFRTWTVPEGEGPVWASLLHLADLRSRYSHLPYGDQAIFLCAEAFEKVGGFPQLPLMEDVEFSRQLRRLGKVRVAPAVVHVSARRFLNRPLYYAVLMNILPILYRLGVPVHVLCGMYKDER